MDIRSNRADITRRIFWAVSLILFSISGAARAADSLGVETSPDSALSVVLAQLPGSNISLDEAVTLALAHATQANDAKAAVQAARGAARSARGAFDPELFAQILRTDSHLPEASPFAGASLLKLKETDNSVGARILFGFGTRLEASLSGVRLESNSIYTTLNPQYSALGQLKLVQPLLRGFGPGTGAGRSAADHALESATAGYQDAALSVIASVEQNYWDLYAAERDFAVEQIVRDRAAAFLHDTELRAKAGLIGPDQVANASVFLADQEQQLLDRQENLDKISDQLASLIGQRPASPAARYRPSSEPPRNFAFGDIDSLVALTKKSNRSLKAAELQVASIRSLVTGARWNALPSLDLVGSLSTNGLSGTPQVVVSGTDTLTSSFGGGAGEAYKQSLRDNYPTWSIGVRLSYPIGSRLNGGERDRLHGELLRAEQQYIAVQRSVEDQVRVSYRELQNAKRRLEVAETGVKASEEQVRIGLLEYKAGRTTAFEIVRLAADLAAAQQRYSQALVRAAKAAADLRRLTSAGETVPEIS